MHDRAIKLPGQLRLPVRAGDAYPLRCADARSLAGAAVTTLHMPIPPRPRAHFLETLRAEVREGVPALRVLSAGMPIREPAAETCRGLAYGRPAVYREGGSHLTRPAAAPGFG